MKKQRGKKIRLHPDTVTLIKQVFFGICIFAVVALMVTGVWYGTRLEAVTLSEVTVTGGETIEHHIIKDRAEEQLQGTYLRLIPRSFAYLYPRQDVLAAIANVDRIKDITLERRGGTKLQIFFEEYRADALWCTTENTDCLFVDKESFAFSAAPDLSGGSFLRFITTGSDPEVGQSVMSAEKKLQLDLLVSSLQGKGWYVRQVEIDSVGDGYIQLVEGGELKIALDQPGLQTFDNLVTVLAAEEFTEVAPGSFKYIDLRFGDKVFVNRTFEEVATSTATGLVEFEIQPDIEIIAVPETELANSASSSGVVEVEEVEIASTSTEAQETEEDIE